jgi:hypothetical protein
MLQWMGTHCPQGHAQNGQHNHSHCTWHCGWLDIQSGSGREADSIDMHVTRVWSLCNIPLQTTTLDGEYSPRGPPSKVLQIA